MNESRTLAMNGRPSTCSVHTSSAASVISMRSSALRHGTVSPSTTMQAPERTGSGNVSRTLDDGPNTSGRTASECAFTGMSSSARRSGVRMGPPADSA